ncbi:cytochrome b5-like [Aricia agestis]|uniref:cytochrome b5-like n=1 Tax=Aricia agestis TaxID=91739 RepID=UPI001C201884|nr:cytochrome b5-like [Aricia agestis]
MSKVITSEEVIKHNSNDSVWMVIRNDVYDVTSFLEEHPGGEETLLEVAGQDATQAFDDVGHSEDAKELLKKYKIGSLPPGETMPNVVPQQKPNCCEKVKQIVMVSSVVAGAILVAIVLRKYLASN